MEASIMSFKMASLLVHSDDVPPSAREALRAAHEVGAENREQLLEAAARILHDEVGIGCADACELVDLGAGGC
jgi:hypothetical protein